MRFLHLSDLHIGRKLNEYSLLEDQKNILDQAAETAENQNCDGVLIAGDIYDKPSPSAEAMDLFDSFISRIAGLKKKVWLISGNHDSAGRISYYSEIIRHSGIYAPDRFSGILQSFDAGENITIHLLPFVKPGTVKPFYPDTSIKTYEDAVRTVIENSPIDKSRINIIVSHQFITGGATCDSEDFAIGGLDSISACIFDNFDYAALGHLHKAQKCGRETIRYAGSPLKYSVSEEEHKKSFTIADIKGKNDIEITQIPVTLPHDVRTARGTLDELMDMEYTEDYIKAVVTDEIVTPDARITLRSTFPNMLRFCVDNSKTQFEYDVEADFKADSLTAAELFCEFYAFQNNGVYPSDTQTELVTKIFDRLEAEK